MPDVKVPFSHQAVLDGYWEYFHDDSCGVTMWSNGYCPVCQFHPDLQSLSARRTNKL